MSVPQTESTREAELSSAPHPPRLAWILIGLGAICLLAAIFDLLSAGHGSQVLHDFAERRSYNMVKRGVHAALPRVASLAAIGSLLILAGRRVMRRGRRAL